MDAEPGGILYLQEFFSDSVNEIAFRINGQMNMTEQEAKNIAEPIVKEIHNIKEAMNQPDLSYLYDLTTMELIQVFDYKYISDFTMIEEDSKLESSTNSEFKCPNG